METSIGAALPAELPAAILARRQTLPRKPAPVTLSGSIVRLTPLDLDRDVEQLHLVSNGQAARVGDRAIDRYDAESLIWRYLSAAPSPPPPTSGPTSSFKSTPPIASPSASATSPPTTRSASPPS